MSFELPEKHRIFCCPGEEEYLSISVSASSRIEAFLAIYWFIVFDTLVDVVKKTYIDYSILYYLFLLLSKWIICMRKLKEALIIHGFKKFKGLNMTYQFL